MVKCKSCGSTEMEYKGEQPTRKGILYGYHCKDATCKLYDSWQSFDMGAWTMQTALESSRATAAALKETK